MPDLQSQDILKALEKGHLAPFYLFYGPGEFRLEKTLERVRESYIPESARDFNQEVLYADETAPQEIMNHALSMPFLSPRRLLVVRRTEALKAQGLETFLPYLERPPDTTCLIFVSSKPDFKLKFYKRIRSLGRAVQFGDLRERQVIPWIRSTAGEMGLHIEQEACAYLQQIVGANLRELYGELEKLYLRHGNKRVGLEDVRETVIHSRMYTIFELMNLFSSKDCGACLRALDRFLEEEDKRGGPLRLIGMLNRQIRLLWQTKMVLEKGGGTREVAARLALPPFSAKEFVARSKYWTHRELVKGLGLLYEVDGRLKFGAGPKPVLENFIVSLCGAGPSG